MKRHWHPPPSGGWKSKMKLLAGLASSESLSWACRQLCTLTGLPLSLCCLCPNLLLSQGHQPYWMRAQPYGLNLPLLAFSCSIVSNSSTQWTVARQPPLSMEIFQARILEWVATSSSRGSSWSRGWTCLPCSFCIAGGFFTTEPLRKPNSVRQNLNTLIKTCLSEYTLEKTV